MIKPSKEFLILFKDTSGALSVTESIAIMNIAAQCPRGEYIELGVAFGKSAMSASVGLKDGAFYLVEPIFAEDKNVRELALNFKLMGSPHIYIYSPTFSTDFLVEPIVIEKKFSYVFVDSGSHQDGLPLQEVKLLEDKMVQGGIIAFHDWDSQFKEVKEASDYLVSTGKYEYIPINWEEIKAYVNENNLEDGNNSWHHTELKNPCFVGAVKRK